MSNAQREAWLDTQPITRAEARAMVEAAVAQLRAEIEGRIATAAAEEP